MQIRRLRNNPTESLQNVMLLNGTQLKFPCSNRDMQN